MITEFERPVLRSYVFQVAAAGVGVGAVLVVLSRAGEQLGPLIVQAVAMIALFVASLVLIVVSFRVRGRVRDFVLKGTKQVVRSTREEARPARVVARAVAGAHPGYLAGSSEPQDTKALYVLLDVITPQGRELAGALVPRQTGLALRRKQVVGVQARSGQPGVAVLDLRVTQEQLLDLAAHDGWAAPSPRHGATKALVLALVGGIAAGAVLALALAYAPLT